MNTLARSILLCLVVPILSWSETHDSVVEITHCGQVITTDVVMIEDMSCNTGGHEDAGIEILGSGVTLDVVIRDSLFEFLPVAHKAGMHWANSHVTVDNIEMIDGGVGIDVSGSQITSSPTTRWPLRLMHPSCMERPVSASKETISTAVSSVSR